MNPVAVIGAGITGLTAAHRLRLLGVPVTVYEASERAGGVIQTMERDGFLAEFGPNTILETSPSIRDLVRDLGLEGQRVYSDSKAKNRYILRNGKPTLVPASPLEFLKSRLFSLPAKVRLPLEIFVRRAPVDAEESVAEFVVRRLGREFLDYAINPMIAGIYAGDPARLSVTHAFPKLHETEQRYGSLLLGQFLGGRERRQRKEVSKQIAPKFSFVHGLETLTSALHKEMGRALRLRSAVQMIRRTREGWEVICRNEGAVRKHAAVLLAAPAHHLAEIILEGKPFSASAPLAFLREIPYAPVASLVLGFRREQVEHPLDGFGVLIPAVEQRDILGVIFTSSLFPNRAPKDNVTLTCYLGGMRSPSMAASDAGWSLEVALRNLRSILGVNGQPVFVQHALFRKAIPQYEVGFGRFKTLMNELESSRPGLFLAGHFRDGISLSDSMVAGDKAGTRIHAFLNSAGNQSDPMLAGTEEIFEPLLS